MWMKYLLILPKSLFNTYIHFDCNHRWYLCCDFFKWWLQKLNSCYRWEICVLSSYFSYSWQLSVIHVSALKIKGNSARNWQPLMFLLPWLKRRKESSIAFHSMMFLLTFYEISLAHLKQHEWKWNSLVSYKNCKACVDSKILLHFWKVENASFDISTFL